MNLTQEQMAAILGVDRSTYTHYEHKTQPTLTKALAIAKTLGVTMDWLLGCSSAPKWGGAIKAFRLRVHGELTNLAKAPTVIDRSRQIIAIMREEAGPLNEKWFQSGTLGISPESFDDFMANPGQSLGPHSIMRLADLVGVPDMWLMLGEHYSEPVGLDYGQDEYTAVMREFADRNLKPELILSAMEYLTRYVKALETSKAPG